MCSGFCLQSTSSRTRRSLAFAFPNLMRRLPGSTRVQEQFERKSSQAFSSKSSEIHRKSMKSLNCDILHLSGFHWFITCNCLFHFTYSQSSQAPRRQTTLLRFLSLARRVVVRPLRSGRFPSHRWDGPFHRLVDQALCLGPWEWNWDFPFCQVDWTYSIANMYKTVRRRNLTCFILVCHV